MTAGGTLEQALANGARLLRTDPNGAAEQARAILEVNPVDGDALRIFAAALRRLGRNEEAEAKELEAIEAAAHHPVLFKAAMALSENQLADAEHLLRPYLDKRPNDAAAVKMLAEVAAGVGAFADAEALLRKAVALAPGYTAARSHLASVVFRLNRPGEALAILDGLLGDDPGDEKAQNLKAAALGRIGGYDDAIGIYEELLKRSPDEPKIWMSYGHVLKTVGRRDDAIAAYRQALSLAPGFGEVWWSLANLKTVTFDESDISVLEAALDRSDLSDDDRLHIEFTLGKALEDAGRYADSFTHYTEANRIRRAAIAYDADYVSAHVERSKAMFTRQFFERRRGQGCAASDPIFILGMPRAGSTLIEQILSSHSLVEGTSELPDIPALTRRIGTEDDRSYPGATGDLPPEQLKRLGESYFHSTRLHRKTDRPHFIDKLPNNWAHAGFIHLILPNAKIIDARRHPLDCCFSNFKQHFARGQGFAYSLDDLGRYYRDYVDLMRHFDTVLPGRVHRVIHERLIDDTEAEVRRLLDYLALPFEEGCLRFYDNQRAVRTASSEQVRRPINREGVGQWRAYERWLGPLKDALGPVLAAYPDAPAD